MAYPVNLPKGIHPFLIIGVISFLLFLMSCDTSGKSIWDPFCKEELLYVPYVRVFQKGRTGVLRRDRGPGFVNLRGMKDIYVCTNGLVMLYYTKTKKLGEVFEQGELHWTPHHCELYNPTVNNGMRADHPKKTLLSILLIAHPDDYRKPALQMFVAPAFDKAYGDYINLTSLIMIGMYGECIIEKGIERARLRVRNVAPKYIADIPWNEPKPPIFCQLDSQRNLGQSGLITLAKPGEASAKSYPINLTDYLFAFKGHGTGFRGTPLENSNGDRDHPAQKSETGSNTYPRYRASDFKDKFPGELGNFAQVADEVYAALIQDRKMEFVGCHTYPDFTEKQMLVLENRKGAYQDLQLPNRSELLIKDSEPPFWAQQVPIPGPDTPGQPPQTISRYSLYFGVDVRTDEIETYEVAKKKVDDAAELLKNKTSANADVAEIKMAEIDHLKEAMLFSLWPLKKAYADLYKYNMEQYIAALEEQMSQSVWFLHNVTGCHNMALENSSDVETDLPIFNVDYKTSWLQEVAKKKLEFRLDPYNRKLIDEYNDLVNKTTVVSEVLRKKSILMGPLISNSETVLSKLTLYYAMLKKTLEELVQAVTQLEKTGKPLDLVVRDPFERYFPDMMIEIADAVKEDMSPIQDNVNAKACYELASLNVSCKSIKPSSERAGQLLKNMQSKGRSWPADDEWRGKVLNLLEEIFQSVCPYIDEDFSSSITKILTGYLLAQPLGTGLKLPVIGSRLQTVDHQYQSTVYNSTYSETDMQNITDGGNGKLRPMQPFWEQITVILENCRDEAKPMQFWHNEEGGKPEYITYRKLFRNNNSEAHYRVDDLMMREQADLEYVFNWAVEMNWRIFATVLGICMPRYENTIPLVSARFYALYSRDFLHPLKQIWMSNRDNPVFQTILGNYFFQGKAERWTKICMESSFMESGDRSYRPPRSLYVNAFTEMNYFVSGPLAGTSGILSAVENIL